MDIALAVEVLAGPAAEVVPVIAAHVPPDLAAELGRLGAPPDEPVPTLGERSAGRAADLPSSPVLAALGGLAPTLPERLLDALEPAVADLALAGTVDLSSLLADQRVAGNVLWHDTDSQTDRAVRLLKLLRPGAADLAAALATRLARHPVITPLLTVNAEVTGEEPIAVAHGAAYLAVAVAAASAVLGNWQHPPVVDRPAAAVVGVAAGTAVLLLRGAPMPAGYAAALQAKIRQEYKPPRQPSYCFNVVVAGGRVRQHQEPRAFAGTADEFAQAMLDEVMSGDPRLASRFVFVNVWDSDREGVFVADHIAARASHDPEAPAREAAILNLRETLVGTRFSGLTLPAAGPALVLRTDFSDDEAWEAVCEASAAVTPEGFMAGLSFISDPAFAGITAGQVAGLTRESDETFLFLADNVTVTDPEMPLIVVDLYDEPGRWFRVAVSQVSSVENNLSLANMFFREFADHADPDGVFRGFPGEPR